MLRAPPLISTTLPSTRPMRGKIASRARTGSRNEIAKTIRVAQVATGNAGRLTLRQLIADDRFELVAVSTSSPDKVGASTRVAWRDWTSRPDRRGWAVRRVRRRRADCVVYCAMATPARSRRPPTYAGCWRPASTWWLAPAPRSSRGDDAAEGDDRVEESARAGGATVYITGVDPASPATCCRSRWPAPASVSKQITCYERRLRDVRRRGGDVRPDGVRQAARRDAAALPARRARVRVGTAIRMMAAGLGIEVDEIVERWGGRAGS